MAKILTLFHPSDGQVRVQGPTSCTNAVVYSVVGTCHWIGLDPFAYLRGAIG